MQKIVFFSILLSLIFSASADLEADEIFKRAFKAADETLSTIATIAPLLNSVEATKSSPETSTDVTVVASTVAPIVTSTIVSDPQVSTVAPLVDIKVPSNQPVEVNITKTSASAEVSSQKFAQYLNPICDSLDTISQEQLFRLQSQFKSFVDKSNGKLALCFLDHFIIEPALKQLTKENLVSICASRTLPADNKNSMKMFEACAARNWELAVEKDLDKIIQTRLKQDANQTKATVLSQNEDIATINSVVSNILDKNTGLAQNSDVKLVDMTGSGSPQISQLNSSGLSEANLKVTNGLMNDPNTVVVLVDDSNSTKSTAAGLANAIAPNALISDSISTVAPVAGSRSSLDESAAGAGSTKKPVALSGKSLGDKIVASIRSGLAEGAIAAAAIEAKANNDVISTTSKPHITSESTSKPATTETSVEVVTIKDSPSSTTTTSKPATMETLQDFLKRQEKEKQEFEKKLKSERDRVMKQMNKKQDDLNAKSAIKSLQIQREATNHHSDSRLHQIEHERQMSIDPIGHIIKHQQYAMMQQSKLG